MKIAVLALAAAWCASGCGPSPVSPQARETASSDLDRHIEQALTQGTQVTPDPSAATNQPTGAADFRDLKVLLPEQIPDFKRTSVAGERTRVFGIEVARASAHYEAEQGGRFEIQLCDSGSLRGLAALVGQAWALTEFEREVENGFERTLRVAGQVGYQSYDRAARHGQVFLLLQDRFIVILEASGVEWSELVQGFEQIDLAGLMAMAGPPPSQ